MTEVIQVVSKVVRRTKLMMAALKNDSSMAAENLRQIGCVDQETDMTALQYAASQGSLQVIDLIIKAPLRSMAAMKSDIIPELTMRAGTTQRTALMFAFLYNQPDVLPLLTVELGYQDIFGNTATMLGVKMNSTNAINGILRCVQAGAVNRADLSDELSKLQSGMNALMFAALLGNYRMVETLLQFSTGAISDDAQGLSPLALAILMLAFFTETYPTLNNVDLTALDDDAQGLPDEAEHASVLSSFRNSVDIGPVMSMHVMAVYKRFRAYLLTVKLLAMNVAYKPTRIPLLPNALFFATLLNCVPAVKLIAAKEARVANTRGETSLILAARLGNTSIVNELLGRELFMRDCYRRTALMHAASANSVGAVYILARNGELYQRDRRGRTALMHAVIAPGKENAGCVDTVRILVHPGVSYGAALKPAGADEPRPANGEATLQTPSGATALMFAVAYNRPECVDVLRHVEAKIPATGELLDIFSNDPFEPMDAYTAGVKAARDAHTYYVECNLNALFKAEDADETTLKSFYKTSMTVSTDLSSYAKNTAVSSVMLDSDAYLDAAGRKRRAMMARKAAASDGAQVAQRASENLRNSVMGEIKRPLTARGKSPRLGRSVNQPTALLQTSIGPGAADEDLSMSQRGGMRKRSMSRGRLSVARMDPVVVEQPAQLETSVRGSRRLSRSLSASNARRLSVSMNQQSYMDTARQSTARLSTAGLAAVPAPEELANIHPVNQQTLGLMKLITEATPSLVSFDYCTALDAVVDLLQSPAFNDPKTPVDKCLAMLYDLLRPYVTFRGNASTMPEAFRPTVPTMRQFLTALQQGVMAVNAANEQSTAASQELLSSLYQFLDAISSDLPHERLNACNALKERLFSALYAVQHADITEELEATMSGDGSASARKKKGPAKFGGLDEKFNLCQSHLGFTALILAAEFNATECFERLVSFEVGAHADNGQTAFTLACQLNRIEIVRMIVGLAEETFKNGDEAYHERIMADIGGRVGNDHKFTALMLAAQENNSEALEEILKSTVCKKALVSRRDKRGWTALMHAINCGNAEAVRLLVKYEFRNLDEETGLTPLDLAYRSGLYSVISVLENYEKYRLRSAKCETLGIDLDALKAGRQPPSARGSIGSPLSELNVSRTSESGRAQAVTAEKIMLAEQAARPHTMLIMAAQNNSLGCVEDIIRDAPNTCDAAIDMVCSFNDAFDKDPNRNVFANLRTLLLHEFGRLRGMYAFRSFDFQLRYMKGGEGSSRLSMSMSMSMSAPSTAVPVGGDDCVTPRGQRKSEFRKSMQPGSLEPLIKNLANTGLGYKCPCHMTTALCFAAVNGYAAIARTLAPYEARILCTYPLPRVDEMECGSAPGGVGTPGSEGFTALMCAAYHGKSEVVAALLPYEARMYSSTRGLTALMIACFMGHARCAALLAPYEWDLTDGFYDNALFQALGYITMHKLDSDYKKELAFDLDAVCGDATSNQFVPVTSSTLVRANAHTHEVTKTFEPPAPTKTRRAKKVNNPLACEDLTNTTSVEAANVMEQLDKNAGSKQGEEAKPYSLEIMLTLLENTKDIYHPLLNITPLHYCVIQGHMHLVALIATSFPDQLKQYTNCGASPCPELVLLLRDAGPDGMGGADPTLNALRAYRNSVVMIGPTECLTALMLAVRSRNVAALKILRFYEAHGMSYDKKTARWMALEDGNSLFVDLLDEFEEFGDTNPLIAAVLGSNTGQAPFPAPLPADLRPYLGCSENGETALMLAALSGNFGAFNAIVDACVAPPRQSDKYDRGFYDLGFKNRSGETCLMVLVSMISENVVPEGQKDVWLQMIRRLSGTVEIASVCTTEGSAFAGHNAVYFACQAGLSRVVRQMVFALTDTLTNKSSNPLTRAAVIQAFAYNEDPPGARDYLKIYGSRMPIITAENFQNCFYAAIMSGVKDTIVEFLKNPTCCEIFLLRCSTDLITDTVNYLQLLVQQQLDGMLQYIPTDLHKNLIRAGYKSKLLTAPRGRNSMNFGADNSNHLLVTP